MGFFKKITKGAKKITKGVAKVTPGGSLALKAVNKAWKSKLGRIALMGAAVYVTGGLMAGSFAPGAVFGSSGLGGLVGGSATAGTAGASTGAVNLGASGVALSGSSTGAGALSGVTSGLSLGGGATSAAASTASGGLLATSTGLGSAATSAAGGGLLAKAASAAAANPLLTYGAIQAGAGLLQGLAAPTPGEEAQANINLLTAQADLEDRNRRRAEEDRTNRMRLTPEQIASLRDLPAISGSIAPVRQTPRPPAAAPVSPFNLQPARAAT